MVLRVAVIGVLMTLCDCSWFGPGEFKGDEGGEHHLRAARRRRRQASGGGSSGGGGCGAHTNCPQGAFCSAADEAGDVPGCYACAECEHDGDGVTPCRPRCADTLLPRAAQAPAAPRSPTSEMAQLANRTAVGPVYTATVVTAYFKFPSKHSSATYYGWMKAMLAVDAPLVVYTSPECLAHIRRLRPSWQRPRTKFITKPLDAFAWSAPFASRPNFWKDQSSKDEERKQAHHGVSADLYRVWDSKLEMVNAVAKANPFGTRLFFWLDIGSLRSGASYKHVWPARNRAALVPSGKVVVTEVSPGYLAGGLFGGDAGAIAWYAAAFYAELGRRADKRQFIGKDQSIMMKLYADSPIHFVSIRNPMENPRARAAFDAKCGSELGSWYVMWRYFASSHDRRIHHCHKRWPPLFSRATAPTARRRAQRARGRARRRRGHN